MGVLTPIDSRVAGPGLNRVESLKPHYNLSAAAISGNELELCKETKREKEKKVL